MKKALIAILTLTMILMTVFIGTATYYHVAVDWVAEPIIAVAISVVAYLVAHPWKHLQDFEQTKK